MPGLSGKNRQWLAQVCVVPDKFSCRHKIHSALQESVLLEMPSAGQERSTNVKQQQIKSSVLVINDELHQLAVLQEVLRDAGFSVLKAADGDEGYKVAKLEHPDLVISDVTMPKVSGIQLCRLIRSDDELQTTPVLLAIAPRPVCA